MSIDLEELESQQDAKDFRRANGAPMVHRPDGSGKWERYSRPSSMGGNLEDENNLTNWKITRAMVGVAHTPSIAAAVIACRDGDRETHEQLRQRAIQAGRGDEAADLGTALHAITQRVEEDPTFKVPPPFDVDVAAYLECLLRAGLVSRWIEVKVCSDEHRCAGTTDRLYEATKHLEVPGFSPIEPGDIICGDLKTGKKFDYSHREYAIQTAIYVDGCFYDVNTNQRSPFPDRLRTDLGLLMHMPVGQATCTPVWVDLQVGREGAILTRAVRAWRKRTDDIFPFTFPAEDLASEMASLADVEPVEAVPPSAEEDGLPVEDVDGWVAAMMVFAQERINVIGRYSTEARNLLLRRWPVGVEPLTESRPLPSQMTEVLDVLDAVEAAYDIPFPANDPRVEWHRNERAQDLDALRARNQPSKPGATQP